MGPFNFLFGGGGPKVAPPPKPVMPPPKPVAPFRPPVAKIPQAPAPVVARAPAPKQPNLVARTAPKAENLIKGIVHPFSTLVSAAAHVPQAVYREVQNKPINDIQKSVFGTNKQGDIAKQIIGDTLQAATLAVGGGASKAAEEGLTKIGAGKLAVAAGRRAAAAATQGGTAFGTNVALNKLNTGKFNVGSAAKNSIIPAVAGAVLPGKSISKTGPTKVNAANFVKNVAPAKIQDTGNFTSDLKTNLKRVAGTREWNVLSGESFIKQAERDPGNTENVYHAAEGEGSKLNADEQRVSNANNLIKNATHAKEDAATGEKTSVDSNYQHRIAQDKNTKSEQYLEGERREPFEGAMRTTSDSGKRATMQALTDNKGNRVIVSTKGDRVVQLKPGGKGEVDMGARTYKPPAQISKNFDPAQRQAMDDTARSLGVKNTIVQKIRGNAAGTFTPATKTVRTEAASPDDVMLHEIGHAADQKLGIQNKFFGGKTPKSDMILDRQVKSYQKLKGALPKDSPIRKDYDQMIGQAKNQKTINKEMRDLTDKRGAANPSQAKYLRRGDEKIATMFQAYLHTPDLFKKTAPTTYKMFTKLLNDNPELHPVRDMKPSLVLANEKVGAKLNPGQFMDKTGKIWNLGRATTKEIEAHSDTSYIHDALHTSAVDHVNTVNAANAKALKDWLENHPEYDKHIVNAQSKTPPSDFKDVNSNYFPGYKADKATAKILNQYVGKSAERTSLDRAMGGINSAATQFIVANPLIHGENLIVQAFIQGGKVPLINTDNALLRKIPSGPLVAVRMVKAMYQMRDPQVREGMLKEYLTEGGHLEGYGKNMDSALTGATHGLNKLNARAMSALDTNIRVLSYVVNRAAGEDPAKAIDDIDTFLGDKSNQGQIERNAVLFGNWLRTEGKATVGTLKNPGALASAATVFGAVAAINTGLRAVTGNPNAKTRFPGELGLVHDIASPVVSAIQGNGSNASEALKSDLTSHITPVVSAGLNQIAGKNVFTGTPLNTNQSRAEDIGKTLFAPATNIGKVTGSRMSPVEAGLNEYGGVTLPHAAGNPAAPNFKTGPAAAVNTSGAKPAFGTDKTGYQQEISYYNSVDAAKNSLSSPADAHSLSTLNTYLNKSKDQDGNSVQLSPAESASQWGSLAGDSKALAAVAKIESSGDDPDPAWKLSGNGTVINKDGQPSNASKLQIYAQYESELNGSAERSQLEQLNPWLVPTFNAEQKWFNDGVSKGTSVPYNGPLPGGLTMKDIQYPTLTNAQNSMMNLVTSLTSIPSANRTQAQINQLDMVENDPSLQQAYDKLNTYTNNMRVAKGAPPLNTSPNESPAVAAAISDYDALPSGTGARTNWINAHPQLYTQMENYYEASDLAEVEKGGAEAQLQGNQPSNDLLSGAYGLGQYDIAKGTNANGTSSYSLNPAAAYAASSGGSGSSYNSSSSYPLSTPSPDTSSIDKLISLLTGSGTKSTKPKTASIKKSFTSGKGNYHVKQVSMPKSEKLPKLTKYKAPTYVSSDGSIKF